MTRFVIATEDISARDANLITGFLKTKHYGYWHWLENLWLVPGVPESTTARKLYDEIEAGIGGVFDQGQILVFSIDPPITHWGSISDKAWIWMKDRWGKPE